MISRTVVVSLDTSFRTMNRGSYTFMKIAIDPRIAAFQLDYKDPYVLADAATFTSVTPSLLHRYEEPVCRILGDSLGG